MRAVHAFLLTATTVIVLGTVPHPLLASPLSPLLVSPGDETGAQILDACPTFSWAPRDAVEQVEILVAMRDQVEGQRPAYRPVLRKLLPGSASSWTPPLESCLERGRTYAWMARGLDAEVSGEWSELRLFTVTRSEVIAATEEPVDTLTDGGEDTSDHETTFPSSGAIESSPNIPALEDPGLEIVGDPGLLLMGFVNADGMLVDDGKMHSNPDLSSSDLFIYANDNIQLYTDHDGNEQGVFAVIGTPGSCQIIDGGDFSCTGTKSAVVEINDEKRLFYAIESPEVWFEDFGRATLENGAVFVEIDPMLAAATDLQEYHVFLTPLGDCHGLYVTEKSNRGFEVRELGEGRSSVGFDYRIVGRRLGFEDRRLEIVALPQPPPDGDPPGP